MANGFLIVSDSHLDLITYRDMEEMRKDTYSGFSQAVSIAIEKKLHIVAAGDNIECNSREYPQAVTISFLAEQLRRLEDAGLCYYFVNGQHDRADLRFNSRVSWPLAINPRVAIPLHDKRVNVGGIDVMGMDAVFQHELEDELRYRATVAEEENLNPILVCHQRWSQFLRYEGAADGDLMDIPDVFQVVITGDMHKAQLLKIKRDDRVKRVLSPGALCRRASQEPDAHYCWVCKRSGGEIKFIRIKLHTRPVKRIKIDQIADIDELAENRKSIVSKLMKQADKVPEEIKKPIVYLSGEGSSELFDAAMEILSPYCFVRRSGRAGREPGSTSVSGPARKDGGVITVTSFVKELAPDKETRRLVEGGLTASDPDEFIRSWRSKRGLTR